MKTAYTSLTEIYEKALLLMKIKTYFTYFKFHIKFANESDNMSSSTSGTKTGILATAYFTVISLVTHKSTVLTMFIEK